SRGGGGPFEEHTNYYGTVDATPLFVMLAAEAARWGAVGPADDDWLIPAVDAALAWIRDWGDSDGDGFVDYAPHDRRGLTNQGWKDSWDGVNFADGTLPTPPIALVEVQGYVDAALRGASELYRDVKRDADADACIAHADAVRAAFDAHFWDERGWYVQALDGRGRRVDSLGSNPGHALWTGTASTEKAHQYLETLWNQHLWSGWGVRTLAPAMRAYDPLSYHNGSVRPHDTAICAAGAARYGRWDVVDHITDGLLDAASHQGGRLPELFSGVDRDVVPVPVGYPGSCSPQAWAAGAVLMLVRANLGLHADARAGTITLSPRGRIAHDIICERLLVAGRELTIRVRDGKIEAEADGFDVLTV
ncbi:MAG TPA: amylo-alpha-1,6-glucosidase, partial [Ilumatobacteraceae bacterium]